VTKPSKKLSRDVVHNDEGTYEWWISVENARIFLTTEKLGRVFLYNPVSKRREMSIDEFRYGTYQHYYHEVAAEVQRQLDELGYESRCGHDHQVRRVPRNRGRRTARRSRQEALMAKERMQIKDQFDYSMIRAAMEIALQSMRPLNPSSPILLQD